MTENGVDVVVRRMVTVCLFRYIVSIKAGVMVEQEKNSS